MDIPLAFKFEEIPSEIFGNIYRPYARVLFKIKGTDQWENIRMVVDTGADYTILPKFYAGILNIDLAKDCVIHTTFGVGGAETVYLYKGMAVKLGEFERMIPVGFLGNDDVPPLLGRHEFMETFKTLFMTGQSIFRNQCLV